MFGETLTMAESGAGSETIGAVQVTDDTFDAPHPNPEHIIGVLYDPIQRCVFVPTARGKVRAEVGDWIIIKGPWRFDVCKPDAFAAAYKPVK